MKAFFNKNKRTLIFIAILSVVLLGLTSCRFDSAVWYAKPYTTYAQEWIDLWAGGSGAFNTIFAWPITILSWPVAWLCSSIGKACGNSYFWGIFFTTFIVRTLAWPIYASQNSSQLKMSLMQPEMSKVQRKYAGRQDQQSQQMMQQEMMKLYKKYKINPVGCVVPMLLQFPIFMSMYEVVQRVNTSKTVSLVDSGAVAVNYVGDFALSNTQLFGFFDLTGSFWNGEWKNRIFCLVIALAFGGITFLQQKLSQRPPKYQKQHPNKVKTGNSQQDQQQKTMKMMMLFMNVMFVFMSLQSTSLGIYWLIGGIYQIGQSQIGRKINEYNYYKMQKEKV